MEQVVDDFASAVESAGGRVCRAGDTPQVIQSVLDICRREDARSVVLGPTRNIDQKQLLDALNESHFEARAISGIEPGNALDFLGKAHLGITDALGGVASTGTLVLATADEAERLASALPRTHVALLPASQVVGSLDDITTLIGSSAITPYRTISLVTGPSSTADIEQTLVKGVHGPSSLWIILVGK